jgi:predicted secreted protein
MAASAGRNLRVKVATTSGGSYNTVSGVTSATMNFQGQTVDITTLTDSDINRLLGVRDNSYTIEGNYDTSDTTGQIVIRTSLTADSSLFVQFLPDGSTGYRQQVIVSKFEVSGAAGASKISFSIELMATGAITLV